LGVGTDGLLCAVLITSWQRQWTFILQVIRSLWMLRNMLCRYTQSSTWGSSSPRGCQLEAHEEATPRLLSFGSWNRFCGIIWQGLHSHVGPDKDFMIYAFDNVLLVYTIYQVALLLWCWWNTGMIEHDWWMGEGPSGFWFHSCEVTGISPGW